MKAVVNASNLSQIRGVLNKIGKDKILQSQTFYPTSKKENQLLKGLGLKANKIERSQVSIFNSFDIDKDFMSGRGFLRIHNKKYNSEDEFGYSEYRAFLIDSGNIFEMHNNTVHLIKNHPTDRKKKCVEVIKFI